MATTVNQASPTQTTSQAKPPAAPKSSPITPQQHGGTVSKTPPVVPITYFQSQDNQDETRRTTHVPVLDTIENTQDPIQLILQRMEQMNKDTSARLEALTAAQVICQEQIAGFQADPTVSRLNRTLFVDSPPRQTVQASTPVQGSLNPAPVTQPQEEGRVDALEKTVGDWTSRLHQATSSAPELDIVRSQTQNTPFTRRLSNTPVSIDAKIRCQTFGGRADPRNFLTSFTIATGRTRFTPEERDAGLCQLFVEHLDGSALGWFAKLKPYSIDNFDQLTTAFLKHYSMYIQQNGSIAELQSIQQGPRESLRSLLERFRDVAERVSIADENAVELLRTAIWHEDEIVKRDLKMRKPTSLEDALHRVLMHAEAEEEKVESARRYATITGKAVYRNHPSPAAETYVESRQLNNKEHRRMQATFMITNGEVDPTEELPTHAPQRRSSKRRRSDSQSEGSLYCEFHKSTAHSTCNCHDLEVFLLEKFQQGEIPGLEPATKAASTASAHSRILRITAPAKLPPFAQTSQRIKHEETTAAHPEPPKRPRSGGYISRPSAFGRVEMIMGGLMACNDSIRSIKEHERRARVAAYPSIEATPTDQCLRIADGEEVDDSPGERDIPFSEDDADSLHQPHNDPLVVEMRVAGYEVKRILIDTGSSVDLIFKEALDRMSLENFEFQQTTRPLTSFNGGTLNTIGTIRLPTHLAGMTRWVQFHVVEAPAVYNIILGTPWIHAMKAVPSTYHQCAKFPTHSGIYTLRGDQRISRSCFITEHKIRTASLQTSTISTPITTTDSMIPDTPPREVIEQVNIDPAFPERCVGIGADLAGGIRVGLVNFLESNTATFAWSTEDMTGIDPKVASHELNVDPTYRPIKQKRRKLGPERAQAVLDEVNRLLQADSITEVRYPDWLANPVVVRKKNGKWRVCADFTDLNKACPKDSFPLPHIDQLVEATAGNELLSFMDAFSGYNQIKMNYADREKTAFITPRGTYCYKVMPFGLKNAGATYQRLVNKMFAGQLGKTMEVYIDDMLVKSARAADHVAHLKECFRILNEYGMKLNPAKCTFGVTSGEFLGYIVTKRGIEANPKQISAVLDLPSPKNAREVQRLTGRIAALNRFISRSTDKCLPFYQLLRGNKHFVWDDACEEAFARLKTYISTPPVLTKPEEGETLYLYIAVSASAVSSVLVREDRGEQKPIFYTSKALDGAESRYSATEKLALAIVTAARKLRPYFQSHTVMVLSNHPLRTILHSPSQSGRLAKWAVELSEYDIEYKGRTASKSQVLADFLVELSPGLIHPDKETSSTWTLHVDGSASRHGSGVGIRLKSPNEEILEQSFRLAFPASNNEAEYEALIAGLRLAKTLGAKSLSAFVDSQLVANQYARVYETKNERMDAYLKIVDELAREFSPFSLTKIPRSDNSPADALAALASTSDPTQRRIIPVGSIDSPSIALQGERPTVESCAAIIPDAPPREETGGPRPASETADWRTEILLYISNGTVPTDRWAARRLRAKASRYLQMDEHLFRRTTYGILLRCISLTEVRDVLQQVHEGSCGNHSGGRSLAQKVKTLGYYWPTLQTDCNSHAAKCEQCQRHAPTIRVPTEDLTSGAMPYPFMRWAMDIVGPFPPSKQKRYLLVLTDYFTKWTEAESYATIKDRDVQRFVWKNIICRHGLPYEIVTDNGSQFISATFETFCAKWKIRLNKSTPRYPQGNGQAEATNKQIINGLKKRLDNKKGLWADELDGVLWSHRTTPRRSTGRTPFALSHGVEAMVPAELAVPSLRRLAFSMDENANREALAADLDNLEEERGLAHLRVQKYQQNVARYYNARVNGRHFEEGDLVLRKVFQNTSEPNAGKLGANWEGPYVICKIVRPGVFELATMEGQMIPRSWNSIHLKRYHY